MKKLKVTLYKDTRQDELYQNEFSSFQCFLGTISNMPKCPKRKIKIQ